MAARNIKKIYILNNWSFLYTDTSNKFQKCHLIANNKKVNDDLMCNIK